MAILSFDGRVNIAVRIVTEKYPGSLLYEAEAVSSNGATIDPAQLDQMKVIFQYGADTVVIKSTGYGEFGEPILIKEPWVGDVVIKWPIPMDLPEANILKEQAGYKEPYNAVILRNPLGPTPTNPFFIFGLDSGLPYIFVDVVTGEVTKG